MNRWTWLNLSFLIPFILILTSASLIPYHYRVLVLYRSVVIELTVSLLILSHILVIATLTLPSKIRNRWSTIFMTWFGFLGLFIGLFIFISSITKSSNHGAFLFGLGYFIFLWSTLVVFLICIITIGLIAFRRRSHLQRWALVMLWAAIYCPTALLWLDAGTASYRTINQVNIQGRQISLIDRRDFGGVHYLIYNCNSFGFFCKSSDFYDSYTIGSFSYGRDPMTRKIYLKQGNKKVILPD
jgi:hypothetical protein